MIAADSGLGTGQALALIAVCTAASGVLQIAFGALRLGSLVSPVTFRHPSVLARAAVTVDHISNGRVEVGIGGGWMEAEHRAYGFPFPGTNVRMELLAEQIEIVHRQWTEDGFDFDGRQYTLESSTALPRPVQQPHPPLIVGGGGKRGTLVPAARWADEYNTTFVSPEECRERRARVVEACKREGRAPIVFSLMTACCVGRTRAEALERARRRLERSGRGDGDPAELLADEASLVGTVDDVVGRLRAYREAGVERVFLQHLDHSDLDMVSLIGEEIVPAFE